MSACGWQLWKNCCRIEDYSEIKNALRPFPGRGASAICIRLESGQGRSVEEADRALAVRLPARIIRRQPGCVFARALQPWESKNVWRSERRFFTAAQQVFRTPQKVRVFHPSPWWCAPVHSSSSAVRQFGSAHLLPRRQTLWNWCAAPRSAGRKGGSGCRW